MKALTNDPTRVASSGGSPTHFNGTALAAGVTVAMELNGEKELTTALYIKNVDAVESLEVILDGGASLSEV